MTVFIHKGDAPLSLRQATKRGLAHYNQQLALYQREAGLLTGDQAYIEWANQWLNDNEANAAHNLFNHGLAAYRAAVARLARYRLAEGCAEVTEDHPTGEYDPETGEALTAPVVVQTAIAPLPAMIDQPVIDPESGAQTGVETIPNPAITADEDERSEAQRVVDATRPEVLAFARAAGQSPL